MFQCICISLIYCSNIITKGGEEYLKLDGLVPYLRLEYIINEHLSPKNRRLFELAREKRNVLSSCGQKMGVYFRMNEQSCAYKFLMNLSSLFAYSDRVISFDSQTESTSSILK